MGDQNWQGPMIWPLDRDPEGKIVIVRVELSGPLSAEGFHRFQEFVKIWGKAWYPQLESNESVKEEISPA